MRQITLYSKVKNNAENHPVIVIILVIFLIVTGTALFLTSITTIKNYFFSEEILQTSEDPLITNTKDLSQEILKFANERQANEPETDFENWDNSTNRLIKYHEETMNRYYQEYSVRVGFIIDEFKKRGITNENVERMYKFPTNYFGLRDIGIGLGEMANKLESETR